MRRTMGMCSLLLMSVMNARTEEPLRLITLAPGHFHAGLIQKQELPGVSRQVFVYAPLGPDLTAHVNRIAQFNKRPENPTHWALSIYAGSDYWEKMLAEMPGNIVVLSGANQGKIERMQEIAGRHVHMLADKPWIIDAQDMPKLESVLETADRNHVIAYDGMTQRYEITCILQRELAGDAAVFGEPVRGTEAEPAVFMESVHYLLKLVAGVPNLRPAWFFDVRQQGEGLADVGTHLADLVQWTMFPDQAIDYRRDIRLLEGKRWATPLSLAEYQRVTGEREFPEYLKGAIEDGHLQYFCNNSVSYTLRGIRVRLDVKWGFEAAAGSGDTELAIFRGTKSRIEVRQGAEEKFRPEVYIVPARPELASEVLAAVQRKLTALGSTWPGLTAEAAGGRIHIVIPDRYRIGHEAHFALLAGRFLEYVRNPRALPAWEKPNMLAKYFVTTGGVALAQKRQTVRPLEQ